MEFEDHNSFIKFFSQNKNLSLEKFSSFEDEFIEIFNDILKKAKSQKKGKEQSIAVALYLRALKYLFVMHQLTLEGHIEEARILRRNILELILIGYLVEQSEEVFDLWKECFETRIKNTNQDGLVNVPNFNNKKYEINQIIKRHQNILKRNPQIAPLIRCRGEYSTFFSHENIYNIVPRIEDITEDNLGKIEIYIGQSAESKNERLCKNITQNIELLKIIDKLIK